MIYRDRIKRIFDLLVAVALLLILAPIIIVLSVLIRIKLGKSVWFIQPRAGMNGRIFKIIKFRTMLDLYDQDNNLLPDSLRLTSFGIFLRSSSLDELPSLVNVILGDISLVGPRPLLVDYLGYYNDHQKQRHWVKPGITGWAQVNGRNSLQWAQKFDLDVWYVKNLSFKLDVKILFLTVLRVVRRDNINSSDHVTMHRFEGGE